MISTYLQVLAIDTVSLVFRNLQLAVFVANDSRPVLNLNLEALV
jgi:hypothetical protein